MFRLSLSAPLNMTIMRGVEGAAPYGRNAYVKQSIVWRAIRAPYLINRKNEQKNGRSMTAPTIINVQIPCKCSGDHWSPAIFAKTNFVGDGAHDVPFKQQTKPFCEKAKGFV